MAAWLIFRGAEHRPIFQRGVARRAQRRLMPKANQGQQPTLVERSPVPRNRIRWPARFARLLGKVSDRALARRSGYSLPAISAERHRRGIPPFHPRRTIQWTEDMIALLGQATDRAVAAELGLERHHVYSKRVSLGIVSFEPPRGRTRRDSFWTKKRIAMLGTDSDPNIARRLGIPKGRVIYQRQRRRIPSFTPAVRFAWTDEMVRKLGAETDARVAASFGTSVAAVRHQRWKRRIAARREPTLVVVRKRELRRLLRLPMKEVIRLTGLNQKTVLKLRKEMGVKNPGRGHRWTPAALKALGRVADDVLASRLGLSVSTVQAKRQKLGIRFMVKRPWTPEEIEVLLQFSNAEVARQTGRTAVAVKQQRMFLRKRGLIPQNDRQDRRKE